MHGQLMVHRPVLEALQTAKGEHGEEDAVAEHPDQPIGPVEDPGARVEALGAEQPLGDEVEREDGHRAQLGVHERDEIAKHSE